MTSWPAAASALPDRRAHLARMQQPDDHRTSASTKTKNATEMTPFIVKNAASSRRRSSGPDERVLVDEQRGHARDAEPVERADVEAEPRGHEQHDRHQVQHARAGERSPLAEPRRPRVQALRAVDVDVEERVEEVEPGDPRADGAAERPRLPRQLALDRRPGADRREPVDRAEPQVAEPREPLQVRVDDERRDGDRREPAHERVELPDGDEVDDQRAEAEPDDRRPASAVPDGSSRPAVRGFAASMPASISRFSAIASERAPIIATVIQSRSWPEGTPSDREERADVGERQREDRVLELDEPVVQPGEAHDGSYDCRCSASARRRAATARARAPAAARRSRRGSRRASPAG